MTSHDSGPQTETTEGLAPARGTSLATATPGGPGTDGPTVAVPAAGAPPVGVAPIAGPVPHAGFAPPVWPTPAGLASPGWPAPAGPASRSAWRRHPILLTVGALVIVVLVALGALALLFASTTTGDVEAKLTGALQSQLGMPVAGLSCPALTGPGLTLHQGTEYHCSATVDGVPLTLTVTPTGSGSEDLHVQLDDVVLPAKLTARTERVVSETVGMPVAARCTTSPRAIQIAPPGSRITCSLTASNRRTTALTWVVDDHAGNVHIVTDAAAVRAALR